MGPKPGLKGWMKPQRCCQTGRLADQSLLGWRQSGRSAGIRADDVNHSGIL